jgi:hypothetical protein
MTKKSTAKTGPSPEAVETAVRQLERELNENAPAIAKVLDDFDAEVAARDDEASRARAAQRVSTLMLAKEEWLALKAWNADESTEKPERPSTPNLDLIQKEHDMPANMKTSKTKSTGTGRARLGVAYVVDGKIMQMKNRPYTLGYLAFEHSAGIDGGARMTTADFRALLVKLGVADPNAPFAPVVLGNGKQIEGIVLGSSTVSPVNGKPAAKSAEPVGVKPVEKASSPRARAAAKADKKTAPKATAAKKTAAPRKATAAKKSQPEVTPIPKSTSKPRARKSA